MTGSTLCLQTENDGLARYLALLLPAYLPVTVRTGAPEEEDLLIVHTRLPDLAPDRQIVLPNQPLRLGALLDQMTACLKGVPPHIVFGPYTLAVNSLDLRQGEAIIRLTEKEAALLHHLHAAGDTVERAVLLAEIWGYGEGLDTHTLETHIYRLRQKLEADPASPLHLVTDGSGYRLIR